MLLRVTLRVYRGSAEGLTNGDSFKGYDTKGDTVTRVILCDYFWMV